MLLTISVGAASGEVPASDFGFLLHKHPDRVQSFPLSFGVAHVFYPESSGERCTAALLLDVDPIRLARGKLGGKGESSGPLGRYVSDRPFVASSFLSVAISQVFSSALAGTCHRRPELVGARWPLQVTLAVLPHKQGSDDLVTQMFGPLGYEVESTQHPLDSTRESWGLSPYSTVTLRRVGTLRELLAHLYVLIPVLDREKHYFIGEAEVEKLLRHGEGWLAEHPAREAIAFRYLKRRVGLARQALERLREVDEVVASTDGDSTAAEQVLERPIRLHDLRLQGIHEQLRRLEASTVVDLGCGEGRLLQPLLRDKRFARVVGMDTSLRALERASKRLHLEDMAPRMRERIELLHGSLIYRDARLAGFDAAVLSEVIEHVEPSRLAALEKVVFAHASPRAVLVTTPNAEYNVLFESLSAGAFRHGDHRFEWTREEFETWARGVAERHGYRVTFFPLGEEDPKVGAPSQMGVFEK